MVSQKGLNEITTCKPFMSRVDWRSNLDLLIPLWFFLLYPAEGMRERCIDQGTLLGPDSPSVPGWVLEIENERHPFSAGAQGLVQEPQCLGRSCGSQVQSSRDRR